jgi:hypothetical protein
MYPFVISSKEYIMSVSVTLPSSHHAMLAACAERLRITPEQALERAVARLHQAVFDTGADLAKVDYSQSAEIPTGLGATHRDILGDDSTR